MSIVTASSRAVRSGPRRVKNCLSVSAFLARMRPDHLAAQVIDNDGDVLVMAAVGQFVDADVRQPVESVARQYPLDDTQDDAADRSARRCASGTRRSSCRCAESGTRPGPRTGA